MIFCLQLVVIVNRKKRCCKGVLPICGSSECSTNPSILVGLGASGYNLSVRLGALQHVLVSLNRTTELRKKPDKWACFPLFHGISHNLKAFAEILGVRVVFKIISN